MTERAATGVGRIAGAAGRGFAAAVHALARAMSVVSVVGMLFVMLLVTYNVVLRLSGQPEVRGIVEYVELAMAVLAFFALGEAERRRQHVSMSSVVDRLSGRTYRVVRFVGGLGAASVAVLLAWASWDVLAAALETGEYKLGLVRLPMWPARVAVFAGFLILALEQIVTAVEDVRRGPEGGTRVHGL
ncbi:TRAP-type C4-dicarboxylate transport system permease small subunit [Prauserella sediminis]|uniref:TRAP-type C4-dicarboxylate transport system permease small subunit n=1 Tax=Prauserella sediminis TaxID=577680 RepID=A0A839Y0P5_9PSEU|nr:TRAP transporter small permease [Prauserella sediminis]MBB3665525.1 TRAP-type C4-dicarboxylate transport system permease small subunit [Prauserella sediminis]